MSHQELEADLFGVGRKWPVPSVADAVMRRIQLEGVPQSRRPVGRRRRMVFAIAALLLVAVGLPASFALVAAQVSRASAQARVAKAKAQDAAALPSKEADPVDREPAKEAQKQKAHSAARLKLMKETAARIEIHVKANEGTKLELRAQPVMRWDNHRSFVVDGSAFVWLADHRPQVIGGVWLKRGQEQTWFELHSLSPQLLIATVDGTTRWSTARPGISWQALTDGPPPATSRAERLRQMKQIAEDFSAHAVKTGPDYDEGSLWHLRMMSQPVYRYAEEAPVDGSIFAFAQGVDPEVFLILESREDNGTAQWHFGFARACVWELHAKRGDREVWSQPKWSQQDADKVYGLVGPFAVDPNLVRLAQEPAN